MRSQSTKEIKSQRQNIKGLGFCFNSKFYAGLLKRFYLIWIEV